MAEHGNFLEIEVVDDDDEFEPLFDYSRVYQPPVDDDSDDGVAVIESGNWQGPAKPRESNKETKVELNSPGSSLAKDGTVEDDDWLPPPPKCPKICVEAKILEDPTLLQLRQKRAELLSFTVASTEGALTREEPVSMEGHACEKEKDDFATHEYQAQGVAGKREKIVVSIQSKDGVCKPFRMYTDDKFDKLFKAYAESIGKATDVFMFCFDGQQIAGTSMPKELGIENEDIIEVNMRT